MLSSGGGFLGGFEGSRGDGGDLGECAELEGGDDFFGGDFCGGQDAYAEFGEHD